MRKHKAFRRVSAWLLVWTMVLSALAGNVTVRAEEPEEVDVQIEADTADQDQIVEPDKAPDNGNNDEDGNQDGDKNTPPTGLAVYSNINWGDDGQVLGLNDPNPDSEPWMDLYGATWCLVDSEGESVQISELTVKKVDAGSETEMTEDEYSIEKHDNVADGVENGDSYFDICFYEYGTYRIYKDMEYTQLEVGYPCLGFYSVSDNSAENLIREDVFKYAQGAEDNTFYMILHRDEWSKLCLDDIEYTIDGDESKDIKNYVAIEKPNYVLPEKPADYVEDEDDYVYTLTINKDIKDRFNFNVKFPRWEVESEGDNAYKFVDSCSPEREINIEPKMDGLVLYDWIDWDNDVPSISKDEDIKKETESDLWGATLWLGYKENEDSEPVPVSVKDISVSFDGEEAGADKVVEYQQNDKNPELISFTFYALGDYTVSYAPEEGVTPSTITIHVVYPERAFYTTEIPSADGFLRGESEYGKDDSDDSRTFYFLNRGEDLEGEFEDLRAFIYEEDKTEIAIEKEEVTNGWKITINQGCRQDVQLKSYIQYEGEDEPREDEFCWLHYAGESEPHKIGSDGRDRAFSGCMLTEWGYQSGFGFWENGVTPDNIEYWVHGDSVQEVLNKLASLEEVTVRDKKTGEPEKVSIKDTGYYTIAMSCYTGDTDGGMANQKKTQTITLSEDVNGVIMNSSTQEEFAWASSTPDFDEDEPVTVYTGFDGNKMACYLSFGENDNHVSGWYEVTWEEDNGIYVYDMDKPITAKYEYEDEDEEGNNQSVDVPDPVAWWSYGYWSEILGLDPEAEGQEDQEDQKTFKKVVDGISAKHQAITKCYSWPDLVLDATDGPVNVKLDGQWAEGAGVKIKYSNKKKSDFEVEVCGTKITLDDVDNFTDPKKSIKVMEKNENGNDTENEITTVSFSYVPCDHKDQTDEVKDAKAATCTEKGYTGDKFCSDCGEPTGTGTVIPAKGHSTETVLKNAKAATCTAAGYTGDKHCKVCDAKVEAGTEIPAKGHSAETTLKDAKAATCTAAGYTGDKYCKVCDAKVEAGTEIAATGHKWDEGKVTKEATETEKGVKTYTCEVCKATKTEDIPVLEKKVEDKGTPITDPEKGDNYKVTSDSNAKEPTVEYTAPKKDSKATTVKVPDTVTDENGVEYKVTSIADNAFKGNKQVKKVTISKNVTSIGKNAFSGCTKLTSVTVGSNVTKIGDSAFKGCSAMTKITLPAKVEKIGKNAFASCKKLKTITIKSTKLTAKNISKGAFKGVTTKTTIKVPKKKLNAYKKLFQQKGLSKKVKIKKA